MMHQPADASKHFRLARPENGSERASWSNSCQGQSLLQRWISCGSEPLRMFLIINTLRLQQEVVALREGLGSASESWRPDAVASNEAKFLALALPPFAKQEEVAALRESLQARLRELEAVVEAKVMELTDATNKNVQLGARVRPFGTCLLSLVLCIKTPRLRSALAPKHCQKFVAHGAEELVVWIVRVTE